MREFSDTSIAKADKIASEMNSTLADCREIGILLANQHRYLANETFKVFVHMVNEMADQADKSYYDDRNAYAVKLSRELRRVIEEFTLVP